MRLPASGQRQNFDPPLAVSIGDSYSEDQIYS